MYIISVFVGLLAHMKEEKRKVFQQMTKEYKDQASVSLAAFYFRSLTDAFWDNCKSKIEATILPFLITKYLLEV